MDKQTINALSPDKPFVPIDEQINLLLKRNITINDFEYAVSILSNVSYYTLINGYKDKFLLEDNETFVDNITIEMLFKIHLIDLDIHSIVLKYILHIERTFKSKLAYLVAENFGVVTDYSNHRVNVQNDYLAESNYKRTRRRVNILNRIKKNIRDCKVNTTTQYYKENRNHVPPWIIVNDIPLGTTIEWYKLLEDEHKNIISSGMIDFNNAINDRTRRYILLQSLYLLRDYRNKIAHGNRTFSALVESKLPKHEMIQLLGERLVRKDEYHDVPMNDFYSIIVSIATLINDATVFKMFMIDFSTILKKYESLQFSTLSIYDIFNIPEDFESRIISLFKRRMSSK